MNLATALFFSILALVILGAFWIFAHYFYAPHTKLTDTQNNRLDELEQKLNKVSIKVGIQPR